MVEVHEKIAKIAKGKTKINAAGQKIEEEWLTVTGDNLKEVKEIFDERWGEKCSK